MSKWYNGESTVNPALIDDTSSKKWVYVRRNVEQHERESEITGETETYYTFEEQKIDKSVYDIFKSNNENSERITDIELALTEIYEGAI